MTGLERKAHRLVELARRGDDPTAAQLLSLHGAVAARIAAEGAIAASGSMATAKAASAGAFVKGLVAAAAIATGATGYYVLQGSDAPTPPPVVRAPQPRAVPPLPVAPLPEPAAVSSVEAPAPPVKVAKRSPGLRLEEEAALLAEVQGALRSGQAAAALSKLESYDRRFPTGMLRAEADAARVFALCGAGRVDKARAAATRFVQRYPSSPAAARVQAACK
jgi:Outer membrane lipoprotein